MNKKWKVGAALIGFVLVAGVVYGVTSLAEPPLQSGIVLNVSWGDGQDQLGLKKWENEPWQGPGTFTTDGARFFLADEPNHRIQVYERGRWATSIPLPPEVAHVKELRLCGDSLYCYGFFEGAPADGGLGRVDLKTGTFAMIDLESRVPHFSPPYSLRVVPGSITVSWMGSDLGSEEPDRCDS